MDHLTVADIYSDVRHGRSRTIGALKENKVSRHCVLAGNRGRNVVKSLRRGSPNTCNTALVEGIANESAAVEAVRTGRTENVL